MSEEIITKFKDHGFEASYHFASDHGDWKPGFQAMYKALDLYDKNPDLQERMRDVSKGFLWSLGDYRK